MGKLSDFSKANIADVLDQLTTDEAISLIAGTGFWWTTPIPRLGIPSVKVRIPSCWSDWPQLTGRAGV